MLPVPGTPPLLIRTRGAQSGDLLGYKVALPYGRAKTKPCLLRRVAGSTLAPDLSLALIRERRPADIDPSDECEPRRINHPEPPRRMTRQGAARSRQG